MLKQESVSYDFQLKYRFFTQGRWSLDLLLGIANWHSKLKQEIWLPVSPTSTWGAKTEEKASGFSPKLGLGIDYRVSDHLGIGVHYNYYRRLGGGEEIIDRVKLTLGDLVGASNGQDPLKFSLESYSLNLSYRF